tara:strand:- start:7568 stop:11503 length:3936 start_codon:yes stop_codon:yes gene_type:complete
MALNSKTNLKLIDAICEGPIEGLEQKERGLFLNETRVTRKQLDERESDPPAVSLTFKDGAANQDGFDESTLLSDVTTTIIPVNEQVGKSFSEEVDDNNKVISRDYGQGTVIRSVNDSEAAFVQLVFNVPKLFCVAPEGLARGQLFFAQIRLEVSIQTKDNAYKQFHVLVENQNELDVIKGISNSEYQFKTAAINLADYKGEFKAPYNIRVKKLKFGGEGKNDSPNAEDAFEISFRDLEDLPKNTPLANKRADVLIWSSIIVGKRIKTAYPNTAVASISIDSEEYNTLPSRSYDIRGLKVKIPVNAEVIRKGPNDSDPRLDGSLKFDDSVPFDGSLKERFWTTCPVCCFYDLLTNKRYGAGDFIEEENLNWVDLIEIAKYCNESVDTPDGKEPRFAINTVLGSQASAYEVLQDMASVFRGMTFWKADNVQISADHGNLGGKNAAPLEAIHIFSNSNVVNGSFVYNGSSLKTRSTRVRVRYNDPDNFFKPDFIVIEDRLLREKYGVQEKSIVAFGCSSKYQAQRMGRWILESEKLNGDTVTFSVGLEGLNVLPGQIFEVSDEMRFGTRLAGRIVGARLNIVDLDQPAVEPPGTNNMLSVVMKDGTVESRPIAGVSGTRVTLSSSFTQVPPDDALYAIKNDSKVLRKYRCLAVAEGEGGVYSVVGVRHVDGLYQAVESASSSLTTQDPFFYGEKPAQPQNPRITFQQIDDGRNTTNRATVSWSRGLAASAVSFRVQWKVGLASNWNEASTTNTFLDINSNLKPGERLYARIKSIGPEPDKNQSTWTLVDREIAIGGTSDGSDDFPIVVLPPDPEEVTIEAFGVDQIILRWAPTANGQKLESFVAVIKHTSQTTGSGTWPNSSLLRKVEARTTSVVLPLLNGEYFIKFENEQKQRSANATSVLINIPDNIPRLNYEIVREDTPSNFAGDKSQVFYSDAYDGLVLSHEGSFDDIADLDAFAANVDSLKGEQFVNGEYFFQNVIDLGAKFSLRLKRVLATRGLYTSDLIDDRSALIDTWSDFDGETPDDTNVEVYFRKSDLAAIDSDIVAEDGSKIRQEGDTITYTVTVVASGGANKYRINGSSTDNETLSLTEGNIYIFDQSHASNSTHPLRISTTSDGTHASGTEYTVGVTVVGTPGNAGAYTEINLAENAPTLYTFCTNHPGMGNQLNTAAGTYSDFRQESNLVFEDWIPLENNVYVGRSFQFKAVLVADHIDQTPIVDQLGAILQFERRTENSATIASGTGSGGKAVTFENAFYTDSNTKVSVGITAFNLASGDYYVMSEPTGTGFTVTFKNGSSVINRNFQYTAIGYGTQQS